MATADSAKDALILIRRRLCDPKFIFKCFSSDPDSNYSKLKFVLSNAVTEACSNSVLLLGPRGCGKAAVLDLVLDDLRTEHPDLVSVVRLNGMLHSNDRSALKEISRQLCVEHQLAFSKMASFDDNSEFLITMLRECALSHKAIVFILDEFDCFAQGKQRILYSLLDALQTVPSQAVIIGLSCRLDADQQLEKRVRSRFSHRKLLFFPPSRGDLLRFRAVSDMDLRKGYLTFENFQNSRSSLQRQPKMDTLQDASILELYILVCMNRLESKESESYNFNSIMKEYKSLHVAHQTCDYYAQQVCLRAFEHLIECQLIGFTDNRSRTLSTEFRPVKLLVSPDELHHGLEINRNCPTILQKLFNRETFK
ncbi:Origin of replication complex subunit 4 [Nymphaea thermarum]|nr:Origin of replication complex subunit 4 [Nymphaea thermarum]